ncbi:TonB-dependent receptor [Rhodanobacter sp. 7MK24]|uniref:TonB-dependent siderophore receptor n=1 Tax=Rhodanobacter sp. 7MK24 TaxID=2775922 RepID=UPI001784A8DA|nr:TonB-dependent receptor [Rhodanobacter sp. 7MK24]MBD8879680.1 TonB-dependent receptor [Rhodanobacter sp. 7MK24]
MSRSGLLPTMAALAAVAVPCQAVAADTLHFAIPPQALSTALIAFGRQANMQVLTAGGSVDALHSRGVNADCTAAAALDRLLQGTGLAYSFVDAGTVVVKPLPAGATAATAPAARPDVRQLSPVISTGLVDQGSYLVDVTSGATRTGTDLLELPASVSEVSPDLLDSQQARGVADAVRNVAGVQSLDGSDALPVFLMRDFQVGNGMIDGLPNSIVSYGDFPPLIGIERVEVLKGPQAIIGDDSVSNNFGGLINLVMKQPTDTPVHRLDFALGQYGDSELGVDLGGPLGKSGEWTYRLVASAEYADRTRQGRRGQRNGYLAPSIGWRDASNKLVLSVERIVRREPIPDYAVMLGGSLSSETPPGLMIGSPDDHSLFRTTRLSYIFEHRFDDVWTFRSRGQYVHQDSSVQEWIVSGFSPNGDSFPMAERYSYGDAFYTVQNDFVGRFDGDTVSHVVVAGFDYSRALSGSVDDVLGLLPQYTYNLYAGPPLPSVPTVTGPGNVNNVDAHAPADPWSIDHALFLQDQLALGEHWNVLLALRRATYEISAQDTNGNLLTEHKSQWVPNAGLVYKLTPLLSLYASATSGFQADEVLDKNGQPLLPSRSRQVEAGAKLMLFDQRAMFTVAAYRIMLDHSNYLSSPRPPYYGIPGPGQTNRGVELEFNGRLAPGLDLSAAYSNTLVTNHDGSLPTGSPRQHGNLWASYRLHSGLLRGWGVAGGVLARSASRGQLSDGSAYFAIPGQARVDANVSWQGQLWNVTLGVRNLLDRNLHDVDFDETFVPLHRGRSVLLSGSRDF